MAMAIRCTTCIRWDFADQNQTIIKCLCCGAREVLKPRTRTATLAALMRQGQWAGPTLSILAKDLLDSPPSHPRGSIEDPAVATLLPAMIEQSSDLIQYLTPEGQQIELSRSLFQRMLCQDANDDQAHYMIGWCAHNRIDPFGNEAYFSVIQGKPVIMVSKDCWLRRMERHPQLSHYDSGLTIEISAKRLQSALLGGMGEDYLIASELRMLLVQSLTDGKLAIPGGLEGRLIVRKRGQYLAPNETIEGAWVKIWRADRPEPILFEVNSQGWARDNTFWKNMGPFMMWKTALKNGIRLAFPELSGLIAQPEMPDSFDAAAAADAEFTQCCTIQQLRALHGRGRHVPAPVGPLTHEELHRLAGSNFDGRGLSELTIFEMSTLLDLIEKAVGGDRAVLDAITRDLSESTESQPQTQKESNNGSTQGIDAIGTADDTVEFPGSSVA